MIHRLSMKIAYFFMERDIIPSDEVEIYAYGYEHLIPEVISWVLILCIAGFSRTFLETFAFMAVFIILRQNTGGYHAKTHFHCIALFTSIYLIFLAVLLFVPAGICAAVSFVLLPLNFIPIVRYAPLDHKNKPITSERERVFFKKRSIILYICLAAAAILFLIYAPLIRFGISLSYALLATGISLLVAYFIKQRKEGLR